MKKQLLFALMVLLSLTAYSQIKLMKADSCNSNLLAEPKAQRLAEPVETVSSPVKVCETIPANATATE